MRIKAVIWGIVAIALTLAVIGLCFNGAITKGFGEDNNSEVKFLFYDEDNFTAPDVLMTYMHNTGKVEVYLDAIIKQKDITYFYKGKEFKSLYSLAHYVLKKKR